MGRRRIWSAAETAVVQEGLFFGRCFAPQGAVAMGKAAEADDDVAMQPAPFLQLFVAGDQGHVAVLILDPFGVLERQQEEILQLRFDRQMQIARHRLIGEHQGQWIGGELVRRAAKAVARILVQQDQQGQGALGRIHPVVQFAPRGGPVNGAAPVAEQGVERLVLGEPLFGPGLFPEGYDGGRGYEDSHDPDLIQSASRLP